MVDDIHVHLQAPSFLTHTALSLLHREGVLGDVTQPVTLVKYRTSACIKI